VKHVLLVSALLLMAMRTGAASCLNGGKPTYDDVSYIAVSRFTLIAPTNPQFEMELDRTRWEPPDVPNADANGTVFDGWLKQKGSEPLASGFYSIGSPNAKALFDEIIVAAENRDFYAAYLTPYFELDARVPYDVRTEIFVCWNCEISGRERPRRLTVRKSKFTEAQIVNALKELDAGTPATTLARRLGIHVNRLRVWKDKYAGLQTSDLIRLKQLEAENAQTRRIIARKELELDAVRDLIEKNGWGPQRAKMRSSSRDFRYRL
jgi:putative transposase